MLNQRYNLADVEDIEDEIRSRIPNRPLLTYIIDRINWAYENNCISLITYYRLMAFDRKSNDNLSIELNDDEIIICNNTWNNHHRERISIKFNDDFIIVTKDITTDFQSIIGIPPSSNRKTNIEVYHNDELFYYKEINSSTEVSPNNISSKSTTSETYINNKNEAVNMTVTSEDTNNEETISSIEYRYCESHNPCFFSSKDDNFPEFTSSMTKINSKTFQSFIESMKKTEEKKLTKLKSA